MSLCTCDSMETTSLIREIYFLLCNKCSRINILIFLAAKYIKYHISATVFAEREKRFNIYNPIEIEYGKVIATFY